jgi:precorrin-8X/cobalt-precorrin-8 methylmutase
LEAIILVGHGSPKKDANKMELVGRLLHPVLHPGCERDCIRTAYLQFESPDLPTAIKNAIKEKKLGRVIIHPYFLSEGMHVTKDIPLIIEEARSAYPGIEFIYTAPLGISREIVGVIKERIDQALGIPTAHIEALSFEKIERELDLSDIPTAHRPIVQRVIHATAEFGFKKSLLFHPDAVSVGIKAIKEGKNILTDVEMVRVGILKKNMNCGGEIICKIKEIPPSDGPRTRAERAIEAAANENIGIIAIGNAPTALFAVIRLINEGVIKPALVIGVPVGFVRAVEAKALLAGQKFPFITNAGRKGGSPVAVAIVNALLKMAGEGGGL